MKDGLVRRIVKGAVRLLWTVELGWRRRVAKVLGRARYRLGGACERCAKCCEEPTIHVGALVFYVRSLREAFLFWQRAVNGFRFVRADREARSFAFECTHFDRETRRCDSYSSRPFMCRDYPRLLLDQPWPELFPECGYRAVDTQGGGMRDAIDALDTSDEQKEKLRRRLHLVE
jgi:Fe-S-cluster containining protein